MLLRPYIQFEHLPLDFTNTPGILYALAYITSCVVYVQTNVRRKKDVRACLLMLGLGIALSLLMVVTDGIRRDLFLPCMLVIFWLISRMIAVSCEMNRRNVMYYSIHVFVCGEFMASLGWQLYYYAMTARGLSWQLWNMLLTAILVYVIVGTGMYLLLTYINRDQFHVHIEKNQLFIASVLLLLTYALSNVNYVNISTPFSTDHTGDIFIIRTLADIAGLGILTAYHVMLKDAGMREEMDHIESLLQMQYNNYQISQESIDMVNQKYHDLKHQIAFLRTEVAAEDKTEYLDQLEEDIRLYETSNKTGNKVLDTIITTKSIQCQKLGIGFTCVADGHALDFMRPMDISSLFGNALDNAIEGVSKVEDPGKRLIHVQVSREKGFLRIKLENCYEGVIEMRGGLPKTTKADRHRHGFGVKSIRHTAETYGGSVTIRAEQGWFELRILIPV